MSSMEPETKSADLERILTMTSTKGLSKEELFDLGEVAVVDLLGRSNGKPKRMRFGQAMKKYAHKLKGYNNLNSCIMRFLRSTKVNMEQRNGVASQLRDAIIELGVLEGMDFTEDNASQDDMPDIFIARLDIILTLICIYPDFVPHMIEKKKLDPRELAGVVSLVFFDIIIYQAFSLDIQSVSHAALSGFTHEVEEWKLKFKQAENNRTAMANEIASLRAENAQLSTLKVEQMLFQMHEDLKKAEAEIQRVKATSKQLQAETELLRSYKGVDQKEKQQAAKDKEALRLARLEIAQLKEVIAQKQDVHASAAAASKPAMRAEAVEGEGEPEPGAVLDDDDEGFEMELKKKKKKKKGKKKHT